MSDIDSWLLFCRMQKMNLDDHHVYGDDTECICAKLLDYEETRNPQKETTYA